MPINPDAVGATSEPARRRWTSKDSLLYALGVGAGAEDPTSELEFTTENSQDVTQRALPTQAVVLAPMGGALGSIGTFNPAMLVHGEQAVELHREVPVEGEPSRLRSWHLDKGSGAVVETEPKPPRWPTAAAVHHPLQPVRRGEGGWGGERGPSTKVAMPDREPDHEVTYATRVDQALLYRLSGDRNPLHSDPKFAALAGFDRPILHGLCTYGFTGRALLHTLCGGDPALFRSMAGRFSSPVFPGEPLTVRMWVESADEGRALFQTVGGDGRVVLDAGRFRFGPA